MPAARTSVQSARQRLRRALPGPLYRLLRKVKNVGDLRASASFMADSLTQTPVPERWRLVRRSYAISDRLEAPHAEAEVFAFMRAILSLPRSAEGVVVEAGCFKGASTAKFSLAAALAGRELVVFDSFQGIPAHDEPHDRDIFGRGAGFAPGDYRGELEEVRHNVTAWGDVSRCRFVPGWFEDTLPRFNEPILAAYLDVDLASSTRTCLKHLYPLIAPGGVLFSQDGHLPLVLEVFRDHAFWEHELGVQRPRVDGLGVSKLVRIVKPA